MLLKPYSHDSYREPAQHHPRSPGQGHRPPWAQLHLTTTIGPESRCSAQQGTLTDATFAHDQQRLACVSRWKQGRVGQKNDIDYANLMLLITIYIHPIVQTWCVCGVCDLVSILTLYLRIDQKRLACRCMLQIRWVLTNNDKHIRSPGIKYHLSLNILLVKTLKCRDTGAMRSRRSLRNHIKLIQIQDSAF